jgi:hypothetical protein
MPDPAFSTSGDFAPETVHSKEKQISSRRAKAMASTLVQPEQAGLRHAVSMKYINHTYRRLDGAEEGRKRGKSVWVTVRSSQA